MVRIIKKLFSILSEKQKKYTVFIAFFMLHGFVKMERSKWSMESLFDGVYEYIDQIAR